MKSIRKSLAVLLALLMLVSVMPMSVFAANEPGEYNGVLVETVGDFQLIIDGNGTNDADVDFDEMGDVPGGTELHINNGTANNAIALDWDDAFVNANPTVREASYTLTRTTEEFELKEDGSIVVDVDGEMVKTDSVVTETISLWDGKQVKVLVVYPDIYCYKTMPDADSSKDPSVYNTELLVNVLPSGTKIIDSNGNDVTANSSEVKINIGDLFEIWMSLVVDGEDTKYYLGSGSGDGYYLSKNNSKFVAANSVGEGLFDITTIPLKDKLDEDLDDDDYRVGAYKEKTFNEDAENILKQGYDVVFFGTWDQNGSYDVNSSGLAALLSVPGEGASDEEIAEYNEKKAELISRYNGDLSKSAADALHKYIADGNGVIFGHDTVADATNLLHSNFMSFCKELGIGFAEGGGGRYSTVQVANEGLLTSYPHIISGTLTVPETHTVNQVYQTTAETLKAISWVNFTYNNAASSAVKDHKGTEIKDANGNALTNVATNSYLLSNENVAMIQTGHSKGAATVDEIKVLANTLFYLKQKSLTSYALDGGFVDKAAPYVSDSDLMEDSANAEDYLSVVDGSVTPNGDKVTYTAKITFTGEDVGTPYTYKVKSTEKVDGALEDTVKQSNTLEAVALAEVKGYVLEVNTSSSACKSDMLAEATKKDGTTNRNYYDVTATIGEYEMENLDSETQYYLHIVPVDNANNAGKEVIVPILLSNFFTPSVETEIEAVPSVDEDDPTYDSRVDTTTETNEDGSTTETITDVYYYPHNYEDKDGEEFDELQEDEQVEIQISATVNALERDDVVGVITLVKWDSTKDTQVVEREYSADNLDALDSAEEQINAEPLKYGTTSKAEDVYIPIEEIYGTNIEYNGVYYNDYLSDGEYTITINWYVKDQVTGEPTDKLVATDSADFTIIQPDYKVTYKYKEETKDGKVADVTEEKIVKYGDGKDEVPDTAGSVSDNRFTYIAKDWELISGGTAIDNITSDSEFELNYNRYSLGSAPTQPTDPPIVDDSKDVELERLGGEDRVETAIKISQEGWPEADVVILATANEFADAMAGVPLAKAVDAPILLTYNGEKLEDIVKAEIARLNPEKVYILGQTMAVNANIEAELKALYEVERVGGKDRFETAVYIAYEMEETYGEKADAVYFVRSDLFPDALSVSSVAAIEHNPILYVAPNGKLDDLTVSYSKTIGTEATIIGGPQAVTEVGEKNIKALFASVDRIFGEDRYATSVEVCTVKEDLFTGPYTALATGLKFPDALTGGSFAAKNNIPVLLVNGSVSPELAVYLSNRPITKLYVFGGPVAVSDIVAEEALSYCRYLYY